MPDQFLDELCEKFGIRFTAEDIQLMDEVNAVDWDSDGFEGCAPGLNVWGGAMLPDSLIFQVNGCGDARLMRFHANGAVREIVFWNHEGSSWRPFAPTIETTLATTPPLDSINDDFSIVGIAFGVEEQRRNCLRALRRRWAMSLDELEQRLGIAWPIIAGWQADTDTIPHDMRPKIEHILQRPAEELFFQDWQLASRAAEAVIKERSDIAWPYAVAGWAAERAGDIDKAVATYVKGLTSFGSTQDFTEYWPKNPKRSEPKFVAWRLLELAPTGLTPRSKDYLAMAKEWKWWDYWIRQGDLQMSAGNAMNAYWCYYRAGWDEYIYIDPPKILQKLIDAAESAKSKTLAALAKHHLANCQ